MLHLETLTALNPTSKISKIDLVVRFFPSTHTEEGLSEIVPISPQLDTEMSTICFL